MSMNLYVGNLAYSTTDSELQGAFAAIGEVTSAKVIMNRETGRSRGFGFVEMANEADGQKAIDELNGQDLAGRPLSIKVAQPKEDRPPRRREGGFRPRSNGPRRDED